MAYPLIEAVVVDENDWYCPECQEVTTAVYDDVRTKSCHICEKIMQRDREIEGFMSDETVEESTSSDGNSALDW